MRYSYYIDKKQIKGNKMQLWKSELGKFMYEVRNRSGRLMKVPDVLAYCELGNSSQNKFHPTETLPDFALDKATV